MLLKEELEKLLEKAKNKFKKACEDEAKVIKEKTDSEKTIKSLEYILKSEFGYETEAGSKTSQNLIPFDLERFKNKTVLSAAFEILKETPHPMSAKEIWEKLKEGGKSVVRPAIGVALRNDPRFKLVGRGVFALVNGQTETKI